MRVSPPLHKYGVAPRASLRRALAKARDWRAGRAGGTPSRAQGVRQRAGGAFPRRRRRSPKGLPFLLRQAIPGLRRACSSLACAAYFPYASALAPALARLPPGLPFLPAEPLRGPASSHVERTVRLASSIIVSEAFSETTPLVTISGP